MRKPPPPRSLQVVRTPAPDMDEEPTTVAPMFMDEEQKVIVTSMSEEVPSAGGHIDPDVSEALRWLDPPSNVSRERTPPPQRAKTPPPERVKTPPPQRAKTPPPQRAKTPPPQRVKTPPPERAQTPPPEKVRPPSAPPQLYTPVPQPIYHQTPPPGFYPTPAPGYPPGGDYGAPVAGYLPYPYYAPVAAPAPPPRSPLPWIVATALMVSGGVVLGWYLFRGDNQPAAAPAPQQPAPAVGTPAKPAAQPAPGSKSPPADGTIRAAVSELVPAGTVSVEAPSSGVVKKVLVEERAQVDKGAKLIEIAGAGSGEQARRLANRIAELEQLAKDDPVFEEFLANARREYAAAKSGGQTSPVTVTASAAGVVRVLVAAGDKVTGGARLADIETYTGWTIKASAADDRLRKDWRCKVTAGGGTSAPCSLTEVKASPGAPAVVTAEAGGDAVWLKDAGQNAVLILDPPTAAPTPPPGK